jgi:esterase/lipase superfamily enzyme
VVVRVIPLAARGPPGPRAVTPSADNERKEPFDVVTLFWGTDRKTSQPPASVAQPIVTGAISSGATFGSERGGKLEIGMARVTIPKIARAAGTIARPRQVTLLHVSLYSEKEDPAKHFTVGMLSPLPRDEFVRESDAQLAKAVRYKDQVFIFVHGFNTSFDDALYRTAQLAYDMEFDGVPYLFSWPSMASATEYLYDRDSADGSQKYFIEFLDLVAKKTKAKRVHIIAHSMGTRPLIAAIANAARQKNSSKIDQLILAAPDIDSAIFRQIAENMKRASRGTTLFASKNDRALQVSKKLAGNAPRAGDVLYEGPLTVPGIYSIDVSEASTQALLSFNHSDYAERSHLLVDMGLIMKDGVNPPDLRFPIYKKLEGPTGAYWRYVRN